MPLSFKIGAREFRDALQKVATAAPSRISVPGLEAVSITSSGDSLTLAVNNCDFSVTTKVPATVAEEGATAIPCRKLLAIIEALAPDAPVSVAISSNHFASITQGASFTKLAALHPDECVPIPTAEGAINTLSFPGGELKDLLATLAPFTSNDATRWVLGGIGFIEEKGKCTAAATNGRTMRLVELGQPFIGSAILPNEAIKALRSLITDACTLVFTESQALAEGASWSFSSKLIDGNFPSFRQPVPSTKTKIKCNREAMLDALAFVGISADSDFDTVKLISEKTSLQVAVKNKQAGEAVREVAGGHGNAPAICFQAKYLVPLIRSFKDEEITLHIANEFSPGVIRDANGLGVASAIRIS